MNSAQRRNKEEKAGLFSKQFTQQCLIYNIERIKESAQKGDPEDQYLLGHCYQHGVGLEQDYAKAAYWYRQSADADNLHGQFALGACYWQGRGVRQNDQEAITLFEKAADQGSAVSLHQLGDIYFYGDGVTADVVRAADYYRKASHLGFIIAKRKLAHAYFFGRGVQKDQRRAFSLYKEAADAGDAHSAYNVAYAYLNGVGAEKNAEFAFNYAKKAADQNDPDAQYLTYRLYTEGVGTSKDPESGHDYLLRSAGNDFKHALFTLAFDHAEDQSVDYLIKAAKAGHIVAQAMVLSWLPVKLLSTNEWEAIYKSFWEQEDTEVSSISYGKFRTIILDAYLDDDLTRKQRQKIMSLLTGLAKQQCPYALLRLGSIYHQGLLGQTDSRKAEAYWQQGADIGDADCLCALGYLYEEKAKMDEKAYKDAFTYHFRAAQRGSSNSYNQLGLLYKQGKGVEKNIALAIDCFNRAMDLGRDKSAYPHAAYNLAILYFIGDEGLQKDREKALSLFEIAAKAGHKEAQEMMRQLTVRLNEVYQSTDTPHFWAAPRPDDLAHNNQQPASSLSSPISSDSPLTSPMVKISESLKRFKNKNTEPFFKAFDAGQYNKALRIACNSTLPEAYSIVEILAKNHTVLALNPNETAGEMQRSAFDLAATKGGKKIYDLLRGFCTDDHLKDTGSKRQFSS